eukprot:m.226164 g.226164  ORF g.226164 m.226164 type:complete len:119 (+) comp19219_c0_seq20:3146-3502(+)
MDWFTVLFVGLTILSLTCKSSMLVFIQLGSSKIFIKNPIDCFSLEEQRDDMLDRVVIPIQRGWRAFKVCTSFPRDSNDVALHCVTRQHCIVTPMSALLLGRAYACMLTLLVLWTLLCP